MAHILTGAIEREIRIRARPETVFAFFTDPARMAKWKGVRATLEPYPGGVYRVEISGRDVVRGQYVEVEPPRRVVFTWGWEGTDQAVPPGSSTVEITLVPDGDHTIVRLTHRDLPVEARGLHAQGWDHYLSRLVVAAEGGDPGPDPWTDQSGAF